MEMTELSFLQDWLYSLYIQEKQITEKLLNTQFWSLFTLDVQGFAYCDSIWHSVKI